MVSFGSCSKSNDDPDPDPVPPVDVSVLIGRWTITEVYTRNVGEEWKPTPTNIYTYGEIIQEYQTDRIMVFSYLGNVSSRNPYTYWPENARLKADRDYRNVTFSENNTKLVMDFAARERFVLYKMK